MTLYADAANAAKIIRQDASSLTIDQRIALAQVEAIAGLAEVLAQFQEERLKVHVDRVSVESVPPRESPSWPKSS